MDGPGQIRQGGDAAGAARRALATPHKLAGAQPEPPSRAARAWGGAGGGGPPADEETPVRSYESYSKLQQHATEELGEAAQSLLGAGEHGEGAALEQEMEERLSSGRLQSLQCQLEVQRQTSAKLAKMCKENKEEYEACVQRLAEESEAERLRAHAVEQELHKRIHTLESAGRGRGYVSIHGFSAGTAKREAEKKEEYLDHLETDTARLKQKVADLTAKLSKANVRGVKAETQLEKSRSEHRAALDSMRQAQVELQNRLEDKDTLIQALRNEAETRVWGVDKIREQYRGLELDRARLQGEVEELKVGAAQHEGELAQAQAQLHKLQHAGAELEEKNATLRRQVRGRPPGRTRAARARGARRAPFCTCPRAVAADLVLRPCGRRSSKMLSLARARWRVNC
jgi:DNA repair exonuclease SbcCD ATPase subunit